MTKMFACQRALTAEHASTKRASAPPGGLESIARRVGWNNVVLNLYFLFSFFYLEVTIAVKGVKMI